ncbi:hypothetical protein GCM10023238_33090 [Streptomyces heliomycini]
MVRRMAAAIGRDMRSVGVHQGLAPVLDVVRDARWGGGGDHRRGPYLVGTIGTAYVRAWSPPDRRHLKHFVGYSLPRRRNLAPAPMGARERADVLLPPFEMAVREGGARSRDALLHDTDGVPARPTRPADRTAPRHWGFDGTVVADYFGIASSRYCTASRATSPTPRGRG